MADVVLPLAEPDAVELICRLGSRRAPPINEDAEPGSLRGRLQSLAMCHNPSHQKQRTGSLHCHIWWLVVRQLRHLPSYAGRMRFTRWDVGGGEWCWARCCQRRRREHILIKERSHLPHSPAAQAWSTLGPPRTERGWSGLAATSPDGGRNEVGVQSGHGHIRAGVDGARIAAL